MNEFYDFPFSWEWNVIIPTDELTPSFFQRGRYTTNQVLGYIVIYI